MSEIIGHSHYVPRTKTLVTFFTVLADLKQNVPVQKNSSKGIETPVSCRERATSPARYWNELDVWSRGVARWFRWDLSFAGSFVCRCLTSPAMLPFPHPAHRTGRADLPHPALGEDSRNRHSHRM